MKLLSFAFLFSSFAVFAQHEHHQVATSQKTTALPAAQIQSSKELNVSKKVRYDLYVKDTIVNFSGKEKRAIAVNGQIPMPTLTFTEGDTAEIYVHNELNEETSLHWAFSILMVAVGCG